FRPERLRQIDGRRRIRRGAGGARATCRPGAGASTHRRERGVFGGLAIVFGLMTRYAALLMIAFVIVATLISHRFWAFQGAERRTQTVQFAKNVAIIGGFLFLFVTVGGRYSLDRWWRSSK